MGVLRHKWGGGDRERFSWDRGGVPEKKGKRKGAWAGKTLAETKALVTTRRNASGKVVKKGLRGIGQRRPNVADGKPGFGKKNAIKGGPEYGIRRGRFGKNPLPRCPSHRPAYSRQEGEITKMGGSYKVS